MKLKRSLQHVTTCKSNAQKKKNGNALVHNFVALSACATLAMILAVGTKAGGVWCHGVRYMQLRTKRTESADAWTDLGSVEYDLPTGIAGMVTSVAGYSISRNICNKNWNFMRESHGRPAREADKRKRG